MYKCIIFGIQINYHHLYICIECNNVNAVMGAKKKHYKLQFLRFDRLLEIVHTWCWLWFAICGFLANIVPELGILETLVEVRFSCPVGTAE